MSLALEVEWLKIGVPTYWCVLMSKRQQPPAQPLPDTTGDQFRALLAVSLEEACQHIRVFLFDICSDALMTN